MSAALEELVQHDKKFNASGNKFNASIVGTDSGTDIARAARAIIRKRVHGWDVMDLVEGLTWEEWHSIKQYIGTVNFPEMEGKRICRNWITELDTVKAFS